LPTAVLLVLFSHEERQKSAQNISISCETLVFNALPHLFRPPESKLSSVIYVPGQQTMC
jgi:hypothetical protein